jgi:hypothetical protein
MLVVVESEILTVRSATLFAAVQCVHKRMVQFQKLTRNLFLTLHGHNVHRQQRQLSKFVVRYQQFIVILLVSDNEAASVRALTDRISLLHLLGPSLPGYP